MEDDQENDDPTENGLTEEAQDQEQDLESQFDLEALGGYAWVLEEAYERNQEVDAFADKARATYQMSVGGAENYRRDAKIDLKALYEQLIRHNQASEELREDIEALPEDSSRRWAKEYKLYERDKKLRNRATLAEAGLTSQDLSEVSDNWNHLLEDAFSNDGGQTRQGFRDDFHKLTGPQQIDFLNDMLESGKINEEQYYKLLEEYGF